LFCNSRFFHSLISKILVCLPIILVVSCQISTYSIANSLYKKGNYAAAVDYYDKYLGLDKENIESTFAVIERSECYYQLAEKAFEKRNWLLATRFLYLANTVKADNLTDNCYYQMGLEKESEKKPEKAFEHYTYVITNYPSSELIPELLYKRIQYNDSNNNPALSWKDYQSLYDRYPDSQFLALSQPIIDIYLTAHLAEIINRKNEAGFDVTIEKLLNIRLYPSSHHDTINNEISKLYMELGDKNVLLVLYDEASTNYRSAIDYNPGISDTVQQKLENICKLFITSGDRYLADRDLVKAMESYNKAFGVIPEYPAAESAIRKAESMKENILLALKLSVQALDSEVSKDYANALKLYRQAYNADPIKEYSEKVFLMENMIRIVKDPVEFAREIVLGYRNGIIPANVEKIRQQLTNEYGKYVRNSEWQVLISVGEDRYEVRYDITTPAQNYFYIWQVNLKTKTISALNEISLQAMTK